MELADCNLKEYLEMRSSRLQEDEIRFLFRQLVHSLYQIHNKEVVHRDLKLENIYLIRSQNKYKFCFDKCLFLNDSGGFTHMKVIFPSLFSVV
jgi:serine/threonine protein kinase